MSRFFVAPQDINGDFVRLGEGDSVHASRVLRMRPGDALTVCDGAGRDYECVVESLGPQVAARIISGSPCPAEPGVGVTVYQCLPKGDKMDTVIQKSVELGAAAVVPVMSKNCVVRLSPSDAAKKTARWQKIAKAAAEQSGRGIIPQVAEPVSFGDAVSMMEKAPRRLIFYENEKHMHLTSLLDGDVSSLSFIVGPEGGFDRSEIDFAIGRGLTSVSLGRRILRTESVALCVLSCVMFATGNL